MVPRRGGRWVHLSLLLKLVDGPHSLPCGDAAKQALSADAEHSNTMRPLLYGAIAPLLLSGCGTLLWLKPIAGPAVQERGYIELKLRGPRWISTSSRQHGAVRADFLDVQKCPGRWRVLSPQEAAREPIIAELKASFRFKEVTLAGEVAFVDALGRRIQWAYASAQCDDGLQLSAFFVVSTTMDYGRGEARDNRGNVFTVW